jgi:alpha-tubulin suppressor-like RCC1 family protein
LGDNTAISKSSPIQIDAGSWTLVTSGTATSAATTPNTALFTWGVGSNGQLAWNQPTIVNQSSPVQVGGISEYIYESWAQVSAGSLHTVANRVDEPGVMRAFGSNSMGQLGLNDTIHRSSPTQIGSTWKKISIGETFFTVGIDSNDDLYAWGNNAVYQLGDNTTTHRSSPVQIGSSFTSVSSGYDYTAAINSNNYIYFWGNGD